MKKSTLRKLTSDGNSHIKQRHALKNGCEPMQYSKIVMTLRWIKYGCAEVSEKCCKWLKLQISKILWSRSFHQFLRCRYILPAISRFSWIFESVTHRMSPGNIFMSAREAVSPSITLGPLWSIWFSLTTCSENKIDY